MKRILIVEDDVIITRLYQYVFEKAGFLVDKATDGEEAINMLDTSRPDLVVVDLMLPKVHGVEVIKQIRAHPILRPVPVIVLSNAYLSTMVKAAWQAGANMCLTKAECSPEQLLQVVRNALGGEELGVSPPSEPPAPSAAPMPEPPTPARSPQPSPAPGRRVKMLDDLRAEEEAIRTPNDELRLKVMDVVPQVVAALRATSPEMDQRGLETHLLPKLRQLYHPIHSLTGHAGVVESLIVGTGSATRMAGALEALLTELFDEPDLITASTLRIIANAAEVLMLPFERPTDIPPERALSPLVLAVDDEIISLRTLSSALELANIRAVSLNDPAIALAVLEQNRFDLIFLDVDMPVMDGFELCMRLRALPNHKLTPVVFVTGLSDFGHRARSILSGGNDLIGKPFLLTELAVKALTYLLRGPVKAPAK